jgi:hypothetical protein
VPDVLAHDPVVETIVRHNVNSRGCHRWSSTRRATTTVRGPATMP